MEIFDADNKIELPLRKDIADLLTTKITLSNEFCFVISHPVLRIDFGLLISYVGMQLFCGFL